MSLTLFKLLALASLALSTFATATEKVASDIGSTPENPNPLTLTSSSS